MLNDTSIDIGIGRIRFTDNWNTTKEHEAEIKTTDLMRFMMPFFKAYPRCTMLFRMSTLGPRIKFNTSSSHPDFEKRKKEPMMGYLNHSLCIVEKTLLKKKDSTD